MNSANGESNGEGEDSTDPIKDFIQMSLPLNDEIASALVDRCGDKRYWSRWADDVGEVSNGSAAASKTSSTVPTVPTSPKRSTSSWKK